MNGPAALPMQYADNIMAFVVTFFVCPAVVCDTHAMDKTRLVVPIPDSRELGNPHLSKTAVRTC